MASQNWVGLGIEVVVRSQLLRLIKWMEYTVVAESNSAV